MRATCRLTQIRSTAQGLEWNQGVRCPYAVRGHCKLALDRTMRIFLAITDKNWFAFQSSRANADEVNFWRPSPNARFKALNPGELFLFKLHAPDNYIVGGGFFTKFQQLPVSLAWEAFREGNGAASLSEMRKRITFYRRTPIPLQENPTIGCIMLAEPFFWTEELWIPSPPDFKAPTVQGKGYDAEVGTGREIWDAVEQRLRALPPAELEEKTAIAAAINSHGFGEPQILLPRLGQGSFRILVTDAYERRCALSGERTLPVLDAVHIKPYSVHHRHEVSNGMLMRSDLHRLFDEGYITIDPLDRRIQVSGRIREEFENGKEYYKLHGKPVRDPKQAIYRPKVENLEYHAYSVFR
jgi:putative restriction endonuclease